MDKTTTLKPCPFCGGRNAYPVMTPLGYTVECDCGATCLHKDTEAEAIAAWNRRPTEEMFLYHLEALLKSRFLRSLPIDKFCDCELCAAHRAVAEARKAS